MFCAMPQELEDVATPVVSAAYAKAGGGEPGSDGGSEDLGDHDEL